METADWYLSGSSPQARGTLGSRCRALSNHRIIPAGAGNTPHDRRHDAGTADHPRRRGEHVVVMPWKVNLTGSSPQARGTPVRGTASAGGDRIIPAGAGNTRTGTAKKKESTDHPRRRGEHCPRRQAPKWLGGSSPQARGTRQARRRRSGPVRIIPAGAGNTHGSGSETSGLPDHPRRRGEHVGIGHAGEINSGSSPQARGTLIDQAGNTINRRIIPAGAGNTRPNTTISTSVSDHPRRRGEHPCKNGAE